MSFPIKGETSQRQLVVDAVSGVPCGEVVSYRSLQSLLGLDRQRMQGVVNQAKGAIQRELSKSLVAVPNVGYRVLKPSENLTLAKNHERKSRRQVGKATSAVVHTDYTELTMQEREAYDVATLILRTVAQFQKRMDLRYASREKVDEFIQSQSTKNERTDDELAAMRERMSRLEAKMTA